jgi:hypothetical protein
MHSGKDRRRYQRFVLPSMYTEVEVRPLDSEKFEWKGHAYDVSEGGMRFELDRPIEPGTQIAVRLQLPGAQHLTITERRPVYAFANVVWIEEDDIEQGGPVRLACVFTRFVMPGEEARLRARLRSGRYSLAA